MLTLQEISLSIYAAVDQQDITVIERCIRQITLDETTVIIRDLWKMALEHAIDIGSLNLVQEIEAKGDADGSTNDDAWCIRRATSHQFTALVDYFVIQRLKIKKDKFEYDLLDQAAESVARNNDIFLMSYVLSQFATHHLHRDSEAIKFLINSFLTKPFGPIYIAISSGHMDMLKFLIAELKKSMPRNWDGDMVRLFNKVEAFKNGKSAIEGKHQIMGFYVFLLMLEGDVDYKVEVDKTYSFLTSFCVFLEVRLNQLAVRAETTIQPDGPH